MEDLGKLIGDMQRDITQCRDIQFKSMEERQVDKGVADALVHYLTRLEKIYGNLTTEKQA